ncbi:hypothetical protein ACFTTN_29185 [Streptomyces niveus]|uniref:hypothetical protein n=1 Tax=Streptomyces niveus TaxID=193462 RepID=UPI0036391890
MTTWGYGGISIGLKPLCQVLKPDARGVRCMRIGADHEGDHGNDYVGLGVTWPRTAKDKR